MSPFELLRQSAFAAPVYVIYEFLGVIVFSNTVLFPPESAIVLDLLMCLPEELPHLNCKKLEEHMIQVQFAHNQSLVSVKTDKNE